MSNLFTEYQEKFWGILFGVIVMLIIFSCLTLCFGETLGEKNNNPLNLKCYDKWLGLAGVDQYNHCIFKTMEYGVRAGLINLKNHTLKHPNETLVHYLMTFAEKNGAFEAGYVADKLNISIETKLKDIDLVSFFIALSYFESKIVFTRKEVERIKTKYRI